MSPHGIKPAAAAAAAAASLPSLLERIQDVDVTLSKLVFQLSLPLPVEFLLSLPGNLIGPPFMQIVGPLWMMIIIADSGNDSDNVPPLPLLWTAALVTTVLLLLVPWIFFLRGHAWILSRIFFSHVSFALSPLVGIGISCTYDNNNNNNSNTQYTSALCFHFLMLYNASCIVVLFLKHGTQRPRPCCVFSECMQRKNFPIIPRVLAKIGPNTSFPSGDVMAANCLALPIWYHHHQQQQQHENDGGPFFSLLLPVLLVGLTALGRMYFLAHHLCDTLAGMGVPWFLHVLCNSTTTSFLDPVFPALGTAEWYHPLAAFLALVVASRFRRGDQK